MPGSRHDINLNLHQYYLLTKADKWWRQQLRHRLIIDDFSKMNKNVIIQFYLLWGLITESFELIVHPQP